MIKNSLKLRVMLASTCALLFCMSLMGVAVVQSFESAQYESIRKELTADANVLLTAAKVKNGQLVMPKLLPDEKFNEVESPIFGLIYDCKGNLLWHSRSAEDEEIYFPTLYKNQKTNFDLINMKGKDYFTYHIDLQISDKNSALTLCFITIQPADAFYAIRQNFNRSMILWQLMAVAGSLAVLYLAMLWTLTPMKQLAASLSNVEAGKQKALETNYPKEINRLTIALNKLLESERHQKERYRDSMADLAHSLKTPLAVINSIQDTLRMKNNKVSSEELQVVEQGIDEQVDRMNQIIGYQLHRAVTRQQSLVKKKVAVHRVTLRISQTLDKVYRNKAVIFTNDIDTQLSFVGEEQDLMEILGNLLENAFRLCLVQVKVSGEISYSEQGQHSGERDGVLELTVEDDGPGIPQDKRQHVLKRGVRADSRTPGQGIGLAVAMDIIDSYGGQLDIEESSLGGAMFRLQLPGVILTTNS